MLLTEDAELYKKESRGRNESFHRRHQITNKKEAEECWLIGKVTDQHAPSRFATKIKY